MAADPDYSILNEFQGPISPPNTSFFYQVGLVLVAGTMLLLPLVYLAMIGLIAYVTFLHAVHDAAPILGLGASGSGHVMIFSLLIYIAPIIAGAIVVFFMLKPLLAKQPRRAQPLALNP